MVPVCVSKIPEKSGMFLSETANVTENNHRNINGTVTDSVIWLHNGSKDKVDKVAE